MNLVGLKARTVNWLLRTDFTTKAVDSGQSIYQAAVGWALQDKLADNAHPPSKHAFNRRLRTTPVGSGRTSPVGRRRQVKRALKREESR